MFPVSWHALEKYPGRTVTIDIISGASPDTLTPTKIIASGIANSAEKFNWAVDETLGDDKTYGLNFALESDPNVFQYSMPFKIAGPDLKPTTVLGGSAASGLYMVESTPSPVPSTAEILFKVSNTTVAAPKSASNGTSFRSPESSPFFVNPTVEFESPSHGGAKSGPGLQILLSFLLVGLTALM